MQVKLHLSDKLCYDGELRPNMIDGAYTLGTKQTVYIGQETQKPLSHSADHITIDWGYLYLSADGVVKAVGDGVADRLQPDRGRCARAGRHRL